MEKRKLIATLLIAVFAFSVIPVVYDNANAEYIEGIYLKRVWVVIGEESHLPLYNWYTMMNRYRDTFFYADNYWTNKYGIPHDVFVDDGDTTMYFDYLHEFKAFFAGWTNYNTIFYVQSEEHLRFNPTSWQVTWGDHNGGDVFDKTFSCYVYTKVFWGDAVGVMNIPSAWLNTLVKHMMGRALTFGNCWLGQHIWGINCLMEYYTMHPVACIDLCWTCTRHINYVKSVRGW